MKESAFNLKRVISEHPQLSMILPQNPWKRHSFISQIMPSKNIMISMVLMKREINSLTSKLAFYSDQKELISRFLILLRTESKI